MLGLLGPAEFKGWCARAEAKRRLGVARREAERQADGLTVIRYRFSTHERALEYAPLGRQPAPRPASELSWQRASLREGPGPSGTFARDATHLAVVMDPGAPGADPDLAPRETCDGVVYRQRYRAEAGPPGSADVYDGPVTGIILAARLRQEPGAQRSSLMRRATPVDVVAMTRDLLSDHGGAATPGVTLQVGDAVVEGTPCWLFRWERYGGISSMWLDPARGCAMRRVVRHAPRSRTADEASGSRTRVPELVQVGRHWLPAVVAVEELEPRAKSSREARNTFVDRIQTETTYRDIMLGQPVPPEMLAVPWPRGTAVTASSSKTQWHGVLNHGEADLPAGLLQDLLDDSLPIPPSAADSAPPFRVHVRRTLWTRRPNYDRRLLDEPWVGFVEGHYQRDGDQYHIALNGKAPAVYDHETWDGYQMAYDGHELKTLTREHEHHLSGTRPVPGGDVYRTELRPLAPIGARANVSIGLSWASPLWHGYSTNDSLGYDRGLAWCHPPPAGRERWFGVECERSQPMRIGPATYEFWFDLEHRQVLRRVVCRRPLRPKELGSAVVVRTATMPSLLHAGDCPVPAEVLIEVWQETHDRPGANPLQARHPDWFRPRGRYVDELVERQTVTFSDLRAGVRLTPADFKVDQPPGKPMYSADGLVQYEEGPPY